MQPAKSIFLPLSLAQSLHRSVSLTLVAVACSLLACSGSNNSSSGSGNSGNAPIITTVAGDGTAGYSGDGGLATGAELNNPYGVAIDGAGNIYIDDDYNARIREVLFSSEVINTIAGNGIEGYGGDGGPATQAEISDTAGIALDSSANLYVPDLNNARVRLVSASSGIITTFAGNGFQGYGGDGGPATQATLCMPRTAAVDSSNNIYIADSCNYRIRRVAASTGVITTIAGNGSQGFAGDGGPATEASLNTAIGVGVDGSGNVYIADTGNFRVRKVDAATGIITTIGGNGVDGYSGDGGPATEAQFNHPFRVALDSAGDVYIADRDNHRIRLVSASSGIVTTVAGDGLGGYAGDGGPATSASLYYPSALNLDSAGNLFIADTGNSRIRKVTQP